MHFYHCDVKKWRDITHGVSRHNVAPLRATLRDLVSLHVVAARVAEILVRVVLYGVFAKGRIERL